MKLLKIVRPKFVMSYPAMSVYEFEYLKEETEVLEYWKSSSIYIICQRPVLYFDEMFCDQGTGVISMEIKQRGENGKLSARLTNKAIKCLPQGDTFWVEIQFYDKEQQTKQPFKNVAGIKLLDDKEEFIIWLTPERLIFEYLTGRLEADIAGDIHEFLTYSVHYIGQAQNQNIWDRLTGHEKLSKALTLEHPFIGGEFSPYELSLIFLKLEGFSEQTIVIPDDSDEFEDIEGNRLTDEQVERASIPKKFEDIRQVAVNDFEAYLINFFQPKYNKIIFKDYPHIKNGLRSVGFDGINHEMLLFATLRTKEATCSIKISPIFSDKT